MDELRAKIEAGIGELTEQLAYLMTSDDEISRRAWRNALRWVLEQMPTPEPVADADAEAAHV